MSKINKLLKSNLIIKAAVAAAIVVGAISFVSFSNAADDKKSETANSVSTTSIAVIDAQLIFEKSLAVVKIREQVDKKAEAFKNESSKKEEYFKKKFEELEKQKSVLAKDAFEQKNNDLSKEFSEAQKKVQEDRGVLEKAYVDSMQQVEATIVDIVKEEATKSGLKLVVHKGQTVYADDSLDMTQKVLEAINKKLPSVTVKF